mmetsp:Transcript_11530/g.35611  ORF Transcript_11530/g.35611 Transcript_11530/m.35611 type:complete len:238 (-) Transcript_11530:830-1543(-)
MIALMRGLRGQSLWPSPSSSSCSSRDSASKGSIGLAALPSDSLNLDSIWRILNAISSTLVCLISASSSRSRCSACCAVASLASAAEDFSPSFDAVGGTAPTSLATAKEAVPLGDASPVGRSGAGEPVVSCAPLSATIGAFGGPSSSASKAAFALRTSSRKSDESRRTLEASPASSCPRDNLDLRRSSRNKSESSLRSAADSSTGGEPIFCASSSCTLSVTFSASISAIRLPNCSIVS